MTFNRALTLKSGAGPLRILQCDCEIAAAYNPDTLPQAQHPPFGTFRGIWDTGASASVVTRAVVNHCGLKPTGIIQAHGANGVYQAETFLVNFRFPNGLHFRDVQVSLGDLSPGCDALFGMDLITAGDFSITNLHGRTVMSFRVPSLYEVDYVDQINRQAQGKKPGRPGSGPMPPAQFGGQRKRGK